MMIVNCASLFATLLVFAGVVVAAASTPTAVTELLMSDSFSSNIFQSSPCGGYAYFKVNMQDPCMDLNINLQPIDGTAHIYVSKTQYPTKNMLTWAAFADGDNSVKISHWDPESSPGYYYIGVLGVCPDATSTGASYRIQAVESASDFDDIYLNGSYSMNKLIAAESYEVIGLFLKST